MQLCQKERIMGRVSRFEGAPSSNETATRRVGPIRRMTRNPVHVIRCSAMRCQNVNGRSDDFCGEMAGVPVALTTSIVASGRSSGSVSGLDLEGVQIG